MVSFEADETEAFGVEVEFDFADGAVSVLGDNEIGDALAFGFGVVVIFAVDKHDDVGVLLDGAGFAEVGEHGDGRGAGFDGAGELREGDNWDVEFAGHELEATGDFGDFLDAVVVGAEGVAAHELEVVDDDEADAVLVGGAAGFGAHLEDAHAGGVVDVNRGFGHFAHGFGEAGEIVGAEVAGADVPAVDARSVGEHTVDDLLFAHLLAED